MSKSSTNIKFYSNIWANMLYYFQSETSNINNVRSLLNSVYAWVLCVSIFQYTYIYRGRIIFLPWILSNDFVCMIFALSNNIHVLWYMYILMRIWKVFNHMQDLWRLYKWLLICLNRLCIIFTYIIFFNNLCSNNI